MSHLKPQHPGCYEFPEKVLQVVKLSNRGAFQAIVPWIDNKNLTKRKDASEVRQVQVLERKRLTDN